MNNRSRVIKDLIVPCVLSLLSIVFILVPIIGMLITMDRESAERVFAHDAILNVIGNSVLASAISTFISMSLAYVFAWCIERTRLPCKKLFRILLSLPMLIPSISIGTGVVLLFGNNGILTNWLHLPIGNIYGLKGIVFGSVLYSLPVAFLMIHNIMKFEDSSPHEAACTLGISRFRRFTAITLPYLRKPMIVVAFSIFTLTFTDYGVPLMVGGKFKTLPVLMYQEVIGRLDFGKGCVYGSLLLVPAVAAFLIDLMNKNSGNTAFVIRPFAVVRSRGRDIVATVYTAMISLFCTLPLLSFVFIAFVKNYPTNFSLTLDNIRKTMIDMDGGRYLLNSVIIATGVSVLGTVLAIAAAYYSARTQSRFAKFLHFIYMSTGSIPGIVLGLAYVLVFNDTMLYDSLLILIIVNTVHFFSSPYLMMYTTMSKINGDLESVSSTLGIARWRLVRDVLLPQCSHTIKEMISYFFVNCMMTISAVSFLANTNTKPVALMINQFEAQAQLECAAVVSLIVLLINLCVKTLLDFRKLPNNT